MMATDNLRPVEALYLLDEAGKEEMNTETGLAASLVYLGVNGYITPQNKGFSLTTKGQHDRLMLRPYETKMLDCIDKKHPEGLVNILYKPDFRHEATQNGFFRTEKTRKSLWVFKWNSTSHTPTGKFNQAIGELDDLRKEIETASQRQDSLTPDKMAMAYAFPSLALSDGFRRYASEVVGAVEASQIAAQTAMMNAVYIAVILPGFMNSSR